MYPKDRTYRRIGRQTKPTSKLKYLLEKVGLLTIALALLGGLIVAIPTALAAPQPFTEATAGVIELDDVIAALPDDGGNDGYAAGDIGPSDNIAIAEPDDGDKVASQPDGDLPYGSEEHNESEANAPPMAENGDGSELELPQYEVVDQLEPAGVAPATPELRLLPAAQRFSVDLAAAWDGPIGTNTGQVSPANAPDGWEPNRAVPAGTNVPGTLSVALNDIVLGTPGQLLVDIYFETIGGGPAWVPPECQGAQSWVTANGADSVMRCRIVNMQAATARNIPFVMVASGGESPSQMVTRIRTVSGSDFDGQVAGSEQDFGASARTVAMQPIYVAAAPAEINLTLAPTMVRDGHAGLQFSIGPAFAISQPLATAVLADSLSFDLLLDTPIRRDNMTWDPSPDRVPWWQVLQLVPSPNHTEPVADNGWFQQNEMDWGRNQPGVPATRSQFQWSAVYLPDNAGYRIHLRGFNPMADLPRNSAVGGFVSGDYRWVVSGALPLQRRPDSPQLVGAWDIGMHIANVVAYTADGRRITSETNNQDNYAYTIVPTEGGFTAAWRRGHHFYITLANNAMLAAGQLVGWDRHIEPGTVWGNALAPHREQATSGWGVPFDASPRVGGGSGAQQFIAINNGGVNSMLCAQASPQATMNGLLSVHSPLPIAPIMPHNIIVEVNATRSPIYDVTCGQVGDAGWTQVPMVVLPIGGGTAADGGIRLAADLNQMPSLVGFAGRVRLRVNPEHPINLETNLNVGRRINPTSHNQDIWAIGAVSHDLGATWNTPARAGAQTFAHIPNPQHGGGAWYTGVGQDVIFATPWLPEIALTASVTNPLAGQEVAFTARAIPLAGTTAAMQNVVLELNVDVPAGLALHQESIELRQGSADGPILDVVPSFLSRSCRHNQNTNCVGISFSGSQVDIPLNTPVFLSFTAQANWEIGTQTVAAWANAPALAALGNDWMPSLQNRGEARVTLNRTLGGTVAFEKVVDNYETALDALNAWELRVRNNTGAPISADIIDILPFNGDGRGTHFSGDFAITTFVPAANTLVYTTTVDPLTIHPDPRHSSNAGGANSIWTQRGADWQYPNQVPANAQRQITGIRFSSYADVAPGGLATHRVYWQPIDSEPQDTFVNYAWALTGGVDLRLVRADNSATVEEPTALQVHIAPGVPQGDYVYWLVTGRNSGENVALGVDIQTAFSGGGSNPQWSQIDIGSTRENRWNIGRLNPGQTVSATLRAQLDLAALELVANELTTGLEIPGLQATAIIASPHNPADSIVYQENTSVAADIDQWDRDTVLFPTPEIQVTKTIAGESLVGVPADTPQIVTFVVSNIGDEPLTNLTLADKTIVGVPVQDIEFAGLMFTEAGYLAAHETGELVTLAPGEAITAFGLLPGMPAGERHENIVTVTGVGLLSAASVTDDDNLVVETVGVHIAKDILNPVGGQVVNGVVYLDIDAETGLTLEQEVTFTITNLSSEGLHNLVFEDRILVGQAISDLTFAAEIVDTVSVLGDVVRIVFQPEFVLEVGGQISGTGLLAPMAVGEWHHNAASVWGQGVITEQPTEDGTDQPGYPGPGPIVPELPGPDGPDGPDGPVPPRVPDNELIVDTVGIRLEKFIAGAPVNSAGNPILLADRETGLIPAQEITFRITNVGSEPLTNLQFTDVTLALPSLSSVQFPAVPGASVIPQGDDWLVEFGAFVLNPGDVLYGVGQLPPLHGSDLKHHNVATIAGYGVESDRRVTDVDQLLIDPADLQITKTVTADAGEFRAGGLVTWEVTVTNHGPDRAKNIVITDRLDNPSQATVTGAHFSQLPTGRANRIGHTPDGADAWLEYLNAGETIVITLTGVLSKNLAAGTVVSNTARVSSDTPNYGTYPDYATARLVVVAAVASTPPGVLTRTGANLWLGIMAALVTAGGAGLLVAKRRQSTE